MYSVLGMQQTTINNIPMNIGEGYGKDNAGKISYEDGRFAIYTTVKLEGSDGEPLNTRYESDACYSLIFAELPCDHKGNVLLEHYEFTTYQSQSPSYLGVNFVQINLFFSKEPTHRVDLRSGLLKNNAEDNQYIMKMGLSYIIAKR